MRILEPILFNAAYLLYTAAMLTYFFYAWSKKESLSRMAFFAVVAGVACHVLHLGLRAYVGLALDQLRWYVPWSNWFESFSLFALVIGITFIAVQWSVHLPILGVFVVTLLWIILSFSLTYPLFSQWEQLQGFSQVWEAVKQSRTIPQLMPALQSYWMAIHVPVMFTAYASFAVAFAVGIVYLIQEKQIKSKNPSDFSQSLPALEPLDRMIYRLIAWGFPILTLGVILGARWAYDAWGRYWGWDAKETWALITWFTYAIYLHMRLVANWRGRKTVILSIVGFGVVLFTYIGVNYLSQLHGFLSGKGS
ncbi:MAG: c-type cytochrome biogenesis protein CcsB [Elusimicrobia bacterium]|nr:c-type cytochrome biogenesis protein CcsB [Elusimicrobiota bacterium]